MSAFATTAPVIHTSEFAIEGESAMECATKRPRQGELAIQRVRGGGLINPVSGTALLLCMHLEELAIQRVRGGLINPFLGTALLLCMYLEELAIQRVRGGG